MGKAARTQRGSERGGGTEYDVQRAQHVCPGKYAHKVREDVYKRQAGRAEHTPAGICQIEMRAGSGNRQIGRAHV